MVEVEGVHQVVGVVSGGTEHCEIGIPDYYASVHHALPWIKQYLEAVSSHGQGLFNSSAA